MEIKNYSEMTLEELQTEEKKLKNNEMISAVISGILVGIIVYGVVKNGFGWIYTIIPAIMIFANYQHSKKRKEHLYQIKTEINKQ
jgi:uncharacterized membrane protein